MSQMECLSSGRRENVDYLPGGTSSCSFNPSRRTTLCSQAKPSRLHCSHCDETYSLPQNGAIKLYKELRCPLDEFELVLWTSGPRGKSYPLCPYCFSNPPFRDMKKGRTPQCSHSSLRLGSLYQELCRK